MEGVRRKATRTSVGVNGHGGMCERKRLAVAQAVKTKINNSHHGL